MTDIETRERLIKVEERAKSNTHQIDELKPVVNEIHSMNKVLIKLTQQLEQTCINVQELKESVRVLEKEPGDRAKNIIVTIVTAAISAIVGGWIGAYFM